MIEHKNIKECKANKTLVNTDLNDDKSVKDLKECNTECNTEYEMFDMLLEILNIHIINIS
jgi:hypothetical protein